MTKTEAIGLTWDDVDMDKRQIDINHQVQWRTVNNDREIQLPHISPHILRHTAATRLAESGCDIKVMQYLLGQTDIRTTMRVFFVLSKKP